MTQLSDGFAISTRPGTTLTSSLGAMLRHAETRPSAPAVKDATQELTYGQLLDKVEALAGGLAASGAAKGDRVALLVANSADFLTLALSCLWIGAPWVPVPARDPAARVSRLLDDSEPSLVVVGEGQGAPSEEAKSAVAARRVATVGSLLSEAASPPPPISDEQRDAYVIYTSGSTGQPKGARIPDGAFRHAIQTAADLLELDESTATMCISPFHFDGSYGALFPTVLSGGCAVIPAREELLFLRGFFTALTRDKVTHASCSPSYLRLLLSSRQLPSLRDSHLKTLSLGGEQCDAADVGKLWEVHPQLRIFNRYGPTEATIAVTNYEVTASDLSGGKIPIGPPAAGTSFWLVDESDRVIDETGSIGELCIGGAQLMAGYWRDDALTAQVMSTDVVPGELVYRTGDLAYRDDRGLYYHAGRQDDMIKRSGVRVSLSEVALAFRNVKGVTAAVCLPIQEGTRQLTVAFVEAPGGLTKSALLKAARAHLAEAMWPDDVVLMEALPTGSAGKADRQSLISAYQGGGC